MSFLCNAPRSALTESRSRAGVLYSDGSGDTQEWERKEVRKQLVQKKSWFFFIILIIIRRQISVFHFLQYITIIRLLYTLFYILRIRNWFFTCFRDWHSLVWLSKKIKIKIKNKIRGNKGTWLLSANREQYSPKKPQCFVWVTAECLPIRGWRAAAPKSLLRLARGSSTCLKQFSKSQPPKIITSMWPTDSSQICWFAWLRSEKGKKKKKKIRQMPTRTNINTLFAFERTKIW